MLLKGLIHPGDTLSMNINGLDVEIMNESEGKDFVIDFGIRRTIERTEI